MAYIYKKQVGRKNYYYLRASKRKNGKQVTKDIAYLGNTLEDAKKAVLGKYKNEIRSSYRKINIFLETEHFNEKAKQLKLKKDEFLGENLTNLEACRLHFRKVFSKTDEKTKKELLNNFAIEFSYNTTSIEGNTITLEEAKNLFIEEKTPANRTLREIYDLSNTKNVLLKVIESKKDLSNELIINLHKDLMKNVDERIGYRTRDVRVVRSHFDSSPGIYVKEDMKILLSWYRENKKRLHPFVLACIFHHKFEKIHPFMDGNGRTGRMLMNFILVKNNYLPIVVYNKNRADYLDALGSADKINLTEINIKYKKLIEFLSSEAISSYWNLFL